MKQKLIVVVGVLIAAQLLSGCYFLRELNWTKDTVAAGRSTTAKISLQPTGNVARFARGAPGSEGRFFVALAADSSGAVSFGRPTFDTKDVTGQKTKLDVNGALGEHINGDTCPFLPEPRRQEQLRGGSPPIWSTPGNVNSATSKLVDLKLKAKAAADSNSGQLFGLVLTGSWIDDGDGVPEDPATTDDEITCTGTSTTSFAVKGD